MRAEAGFADASASAHVIKQDAATKKPHAFLGCDGDWHTYYTKTYIQGGVGQTMTHVTLGNHLSLERERETGLEPAITCLEVDDPVDLA